jgi:hypothetical protein
MSEAAIAPTPGLALVTIAGTLAYPGPAVLGAGGLTAFFARPARLAFRSAVGVLLTALLIPPLLARIRAEETLLCTQFEASTTPTVAARGD